MSFDKLPLPDLRKAALDFGVVLEEADAKKMKKQEILAALHEDGVTWETYERNQELQKAVAEAAEDENSAPIEVTPEEKTELKRSGVARDTMLIKMDRDNFTYATKSADGKRTWVFTKEHPFVAMPFDEGAELLRNHEGFRTAAPHEAQEYYG